MQDKWWLHTTFSVLCLSIYVVTVNTGIWEMLYNEIHGCVF